MPFRFSRLVEESKVSRYRSIESKDRRTCAQLAFWGIAVVIWLSAIADGVKAANPTLLMAGELATYSPRGTYLAYVQQGRLKINRQKPLPKVDATRLEQLFHDLDSDNYLKRQSAFLELKTLGASIAEPIDQRLASPTSKEVRQRLSSLKKSFQRSSTVRYTRRVRQLAFSPDEKFVAVGGDDRMLSLWRTSSQQRVRILGTFDSAVHAARFSPDGRWVAVGTGNGSISILPLSEAGEPTVLTGHTNSVPKLLFSRNGNRLISAGGFDRRVGLWNTSQLAADSGHGHLIRWLGEHQDSVMALAISPDEQMLAISGYDRDITLLDHHTDRNIRTLIGHADVVRCLHFIKGRWLLSAGDDKTIRVWDVRTSQPVKQIVARVGGIRSISINRDNATMAASGSEQVISLWDLDEILGRESTNSVSVASPN